MPRFAANLSMMFSELPFLDRFAAAAESSFRAVEFLFPYDHPSKLIADQLGRNGLDQALFNFPAGNWNNGDRVLAALPDRFSEFAESVDTAPEYADATGVKRLHLMSGIADRSTPGAIDAYRKAVIWTTERLSNAGLDLVIEPINSRNMPGYFLNDFDFAENLIRELSLPNLKLQFDIYHRQIIHGDVTMALRRLMPMIGHVQIASVPSRHYPVGEELNFPFLFGELDRLEYGGFIGCEYNPRRRTHDGLGWFAPYAAQPRPGHRSGDVA
ncbi:2-oxo-tetronate isomerase [Bradyrhizobium sp. LA6.7]|uniref:2-oxo-tetronate isomerase n=1 Tax=unclassified Bradyrhizobium TaxID=2631580 RepID=UPI0033998D01